MIRRMTPPVRRAFTLVELMVAMGLSVLIMYIMAECSKICLDAVSIARSSGQMSSQLQGAGAILSRDLLNNHFDDPRPTGGTKLSQFRFDQLTAAQPVPPPTKGFFRIVSPQSVIDMRDAAGSPTFQDMHGFAINSAVNHALHFTTVLPSTDQNPFSVAVPASGPTSTVYRSRAAEIAYYLVDSGTRTSPGTSGVPLYNLIRRQRLVAATTDDTSSLFGARTDAEVIASNGSNQIYTLAELTNPTRRAFQLMQSTLPNGATPTQAFGLSHPRFGEDLLLSNVLSFEVLVDWTQNAVATTAATQPPRTQPANWEYPFDNLSLNAGRNNTVTGQGVFDTWHAGTANPNWNPATGAAAATKMPLAIRVKQIQVTIRIFDPKTKLARQNTWKFSM